MQQYSSGVIVTVMLPVVDLFAGPGGLGEGFSSFLTESDKPAFKVCLSIEKDEHAWQTLLLRSFLREFDSDSVPVEYYHHLRGDCSREELFEAYPRQREAALAVAQKVELGSAEWPTAKVSPLIRKALEKKRSFVLIGGPPCQAYSTVGRSRNRGVVDYKLENDKRSKLYVEYLQVLAEHKPAIFVMENVKGILSAQLYRQRLFGKLLEDLSSPTAAVRREGRVLKRRSGKVRYRLYSMVEPEQSLPDHKKNFVIQAERYGIPQARHRVIILGIREDISCSNPPQLTPQEAVSVRDAIGDLPPLRSGLSRTEDTPKVWLQTCRALQDAEWFSNGSLSDDCRKKMQAELKKLRLPRSGRGAEFVPWAAVLRWQSEWFHDARLGGVCNHASRAHMDTDLHRYFFAACFARAEKVSPQLRHFPEKLLPNHRNVEQAMGHDNFSDRFRVQVSGKPATTITSHLKKDGHYNIHPDPTQCRSLTVREAARIQTFPDNYYFCGPRTRQYEQVGNAVPPLLAKQIAEIVCRVLQDSGILR